MPVGDRYIPHSSSMLPVGVLPPREGNLVRFIPWYFEFRQGKSSKFWEILLEDEKVHVSWGRIGSMGQIQTKTFASVFDAASFQHSTVGSKVKKGYVRVHRPTSREGTLPAESKTCLLVEILPTPQGGGIVAKLLEASGHPRVAWLDQLRSVAR